MRSRLLLSAAILTLTAYAQDQPPTARVDGTIVDAANGLNLRRTHVILRPADAGLSAIGVETDARGHFEFRDVPPGRYALLAERDGYLPATIATRGAYRLPEILAVQSAFPLSGIEIRMYRWATIGGRIKYDDAEPASTILVQAWRERSWRGRHGYYVSTAVRTNDRGEYRIYGLAPGSYILAAVYDRVVQVANLKEQPRLDASGIAVPQEGYTTTFFPNSTKLAEAAPLKVGHGSEMNGIDIFLNPVRKASIRGKVIDGVANAIIKSPVLNLERIDASDFGGIPVQAPLVVDVEGNFELHNVPSGAYMLTSEGMSGPTRIVASVPVTVGNTDVDNVQVILRGGAPWQVALKSDLERNERTVRIQFEPRSDRGAIIRETYKPDLEVSLLPGEIYDVTVDNLPDDYYLRTVKVNGNEVNVVSGTQGKVVAPLTLEIEKNGGQVMGRVVTESGSDIVPGANLILIPQHPRLADYRDGVADQNGYFLLHGVAPGKYRLLSWLDEPPCDFWRGNSCDPYGQELTIEEANKIPVILRHKPPPQN